MKISKESAEFFHTMCLDGYLVGCDRDGEVEQPYCPIVKAFVSKYVNSHYDKSEFAQFCRAVADSLEDSKS